jgi:hypothetical protein
MSLLAEHVSSISTTYEAKRSEVTTLGRLLRRFTSHLLFVVSVISTLVSIPGLNVLGYLVQ